MEQIPFPDKKYQIIYADPPWSYRGKALAGNRGAGCKYQVQEKDWIDNLPSLQMLSAKTQQERENRSC